MPSSYSPEYDTNAERFLLIRLENDRSSDYAHITVSVVRKAVSESVNPDNGYKSYNDGPNASGYRNCSYTSNKKNAYYVEDLQIHSQINKRNLDGSSVVDTKPYGIGLRFKPYCVELRDATNIYSTLTRADKKLSKLNEEFGYGDNDLATFITRVASVFGIKKFLTYSDEAKKGYGGYGLDSGNLKVWSAKDVAWLVNNFVEECNPVKVND